MISSSTIESVLLSGSIDELKRISIFSNKHLTTDWKNLTKAGFE